MYDTWKHPETLAIVSKVAGIDLVPEMDFEIAHINISMKSEKQKAEELEAFVDRNLTEADEGIAGCPWEDDKPIVDWHTDSYPFVCVTMLSDCTTMIGGETALRTGTGDILRVRGPQMVRTPCPALHRLTPAGLRRRASGPLHRTPSATGARRHGADHDGDVVPAAQPGAAGRHRADDGAADLEPAGAVLPVQRVPARDPGAADPRPAEVFAGEQQGRQAVQHRAPEEVFPRAGGFFGAYEPGDC